MDRVTEAEGAESLPHTLRAQVRFLLLSHTFLAALAFASGQVPTLNTLMLGAASLLLAWLALM